MFRQCYLHVTKCNNYQMTEPTNNAQHYSSSQPTNPLCGATHTRHTRAYSSRHPVSLCCDTRPASKQLLRPRGQSTPKQLQCNTSLNIIQLGDAICRKAPRWEDCLDTCIPLTPRQAHVDPTFNLVTQTLLYLI